MDFFLDSSSSESEIWESSSSDTYTSESSTSDSSTNSSISSESAEEFVAVENFIETINDYSDKAFKTHFRLNRQTVLFLIELYSDSEHAPRQEGGGRRRIGAEIEIYMFIWYISNTCTFRELGNLFGLRKSSAWRSVVRVSHWLISIGHNFVRWPEGSARQKVTQKFEEISNVRGISGSVDGTKITIKRPREDGDDYYSRKKQYAITLQAVVDADKRFIDIFCGEPGSLHDSRVLRRSSIYRSTLQNQAQMFPQDSFLIGDSAYPCLSWLVTPFKNYGNLTQLQRDFNKLISRARVVVENAFGILKQRFRRILHFTEHMHINFVVNLVVCACILHNICIDHNDEYEYNESDDDDEEDEDGIEGTGRFRGNSRREDLIDELIARNILQ